MTDKEYSVPLDAVQCALILHSGSVAHIFQMMQTTIQSARILCKHSRSSRQSMMLSTLRILRTKMMLRAEESTVQTIPKMF